MLKKTIVLVMSSIFIAVVLTACDGADSGDSPLSALDSPLASSQEPDRVERLASLDNPFQLQPGQTASLEAQELSVEFVEVVEDSRCPRGVECAWEGQALILVHVSGSSGDQELTLQLGPKDSVAGAYEGYLFKFLALDPYPQAPSQDAPPQPPYTATLLVSQ